MSPPCHYEIPDSLTVLRVLQFPGGQSPKESHLIAEGSLELERPLDWPLAREPEPPLGGGDGYSWWCIKTVDLTTQHVPPLDPPLRSTARTMRPLLLVLAVLLCGLLVSGKPNGSPRDLTESFQGQDTQVPTGLIGQPSGPNKAEEARSPPDTDSSVSNGRSGDSETKEQGQKEMGENLARPTRDVQNDN
nr:uncharacterized protein LOC129383114 [Dermacentor andersoni]